MKKYSSFFYKNEAICDDESEQSQAKILSKPKNFEIDAIYESSKTDDGTTTHSQYWLFQYFYRKKCAICPGHVPVNIFIFI